MDASATLDIPLTPELRRLVAAAIASRRFASAGEAVRAGLHLLVDAGVPGNGDARLAAGLRDGEVRWLQLSSAPRTLSDGSTVWDGIVLDITERVRAETQVRDSEQRLEI